MSNVIDRSLKLKEGEILPITPDEVKEITDEIIGCCNEHKVTIDHFGCGGGKKGRRQIATFRGTITNIETRQLTIRARVEGKEDEIQIPSYCIRSVDRKGNLYADLMTPVPPCGCEGSCPVCRLGEVDNHKCDSCGAEFCPKCHGVLNSEGKGTVPSLNVLPCRCESKN